MGWKSLFRILFVLVLCLCVYIPHVFGYCDAWSGCGEYIYRVTVGDIDHASAACSDHGYTDYTSSHSTVMEAGMDYDIEVVLGLGSSPYAGYDEDEVTIWVDWNQDDVFDDGVERFDAATGPCGSYCYATTITPPMDALSGTTRMRVRVAYDMDPPACGYTQYGEVEDYAVEVITKATISGYKFNDANANGVWNAEELGLSGWGIYIDENGNGTYEASEPNTLTDPNGFYEFAGLSAPATYMVREIMKDGWAQTLPGEPNYCYTLSVDGGVTYTNNHFGNTNQVPAQIKISGSVKTAEGVRIKGINVIASTGESVITDPYGYYELIVSNPYTGTVQVSQTDWVFTPPSISYTAVASDQMDQDYVADYTVNYGGGSGTSSSPYLIYNAAQLNRVGAKAGDWNKYFKVMSDIDLSGYDGQEGRPCFNRIGYYINFVDDASFLGVFDGNGHTISNFTFDSDADDDAVGLFGRIGSYFGSTTQIKNVNLVNVNVSSGDTFIGTGALIGSMDDGTVSNCSIEGGTVTGLYSNIGGMAGIIWSGTLSECSAENLNVSGQSKVGGLAAGGGSNAAVINSYANCTVSGDVECGGLIGSSSMTVSKCGSAGSVTVVDRSAGGLIGDNGGIIEYCYSTATAICEGADEIGGLVGRNTNPAVVSDCYASGAVFGFYYVGGLIGFCYDTSIENCYSIGPVDATISLYEGGLIGRDWDDLSQTTASFWDTQTSGVTTSGGGTGLLTADMQDKQIYLEAGWDFTDETGNGTGDIWQLCDGVTAYPDLAWNTTTLCGVSEIILYPTADTFVMSTEPDLNYGTESNLHAGTLSPNGAIYRSFLKFDMGQVPDGHRIVSARLELQAHHVPVVDVEVGAWFTSENWSESEITWDDQVSPYDEMPVDTCIVSIDNNTWDVSGIADDRYVYDREMSILLQSTDETYQYYVAFSSSDVPSQEDSPRLVVYYEPIFGGGTGTADDPYQIWTAEQMNDIGLYDNRWNRSFKLMTDISMADYTGANYNLIGYLPTTPNAGFRGVFDGDGHTISDFQSGPLFNLVSWGRIQELGLIGPIVSGDGALANKVEYCQIAECWVDGGSVNGSSDVGGLVGEVILSSLGGCWSSAVVGGTSDVGGLIGSTGALCQVENSYAAGDVTGEDRVGGFIGSAPDTAFTRCYSSGQVNGTTDVGGFCGEAEYFYQEPNLIIADCFWDYQTSGTTQSAVGTGMPTGEMKNLPMFLNAGWDFVDETENGLIDDWGMPDGGGYPILWYQLPIAPPLPSFAGGSGTEGNPYQITTVEQLNSIGHNSRLLDKHFILMNDLDMSGQSLTIIANGPYAFMGSFDGNSHVIRNLSISTPVYMTNIGLFGSLYGGRVFDLTLQNAFIDAESSQNVGSLAGMNRSGWIENCHSQNVDVLGQWPVGGLVGLNYWFASISDCSVVGSVAESNILNFLNSGVGGLVGENSWWCTIDTCGTNVMVSGGDSLGGLIGTNVIYSHVTDSYALGTITTTDDYAGGLAGRSYGGDFTRCYAACEVIAPAESDRAGCMVGSEQSGTYMNSFWDNQINGDLPGFGYTRDTTELINTVGETTENMQMAYTFQAAGWDFGTIWDMRCEGMSYPRLKSEPDLTGDFVCPEGVEINDFMVLSQEWLMPVMSADIAPDGGDGRVNLIDWVPFAEAWMSSTGHPNWDQDCDISPNGTIDVGDVQVFAEQWLGRSARYADIAPASEPDGVVNILDYAAFAENWMLGTD